MKNLLRKTVFYLVTIWASITLAFVLPRLMPGDPLSAFLVRHPNVSPDILTSLRAMFGLDDSSLWTQYWRYWGQLLHGDLGISFRNFPVPVSTVIAGALPWTIGLVGVATVIAFVLGSVAGMLLGWRHSRRADALIPLTTFFSSVPYFWIALVLIFLLGVRLKWLPYYGSYSAGLIPGWNWEFAADVLKHALLPGVTIVIASISGWIISMRNMMITVASEDFVTVAQAKGLPESRVMFNYAARNAILPQISGFALSLGFVVSGTLVMEQVFTYQGIGFQLLMAVGAKDYPLMQGVFLVITLSVILANILADLIYVLLDPRTRKD